MAGSTRLLKRNRAESGLYACSGGESTDQFTQETETMKHLTLAGLLAVSVGTAGAEPFDFQRQIGSTEYNPTEDTEQLTFAPVTESDHVSSLTAWMLDADVDGIAPNEFTGSIVKSGPSRISLYEIQRGSPEGIANRDYHERYAADTDWDAVAGEFHARHVNRGLASGTESKAGNS
jgi:hypothetical protein